LELVDESLPGTDFRPGDRLFFKSIREEAVSVSNLRQAALTNKMENFGYSDIGSIVFGLGQHPRKMLTVY
jgi:hypothetical protein